jgi:hypothetical protein
MKCYYSVIAQFEKGDTWSVEFGDYVRSVARDEAWAIKDDGAYRVKVIESGDTQAEITARVAEYNAKEA